MLQFFFLCYHFHFHGTGTMCCHTEKRKKTSSAQRDSDQWFILWNRLSQLTSVCSGTSLSLERYHNTNRLIFALSKEVLYSLNHLSGNCLPAVSSLIPHFFFVFFFVISCVLFGLKIFFGDRWFEPVYKSVCHLACYAVFRRYYMSPAASLITHT